MGAPASRLVLLGASNLTRGLGVVLASARAALPAAPAEILAALGNGRSFGLSSSFLGRTLPPILACGLWRQLERLPPRPTFALITDIGNDVAYGRRPAEITAWVETCIERLEAVGARIILTGLPVAVLDGLSDRRLLWLRRLSFPLSTVTPHHARERSHTLDANLRLLADRHSCAWVGQETSWYGVDPIHIRRASRPRAWSQFLAPWGEAAGRPPSWSERLSLGWAVPEQRRWLGRFEQRGEQPARRFREGDLYLF